MANTIMFDEGMQLLSRLGLPSTCYFALSTKSVDSTTPFSVADTLAGTLIGEVNTGGSATGYARIGTATPAMSGHTESFPQLTWTTGTALDWPATVRSVVLVTVASGVAGTAICAANLQSGGAARDMSAANTTEKVTPTLVFQAGN